ncbi:MAG: hypothetical protein ACRD3T_01075 [Terriglobia bacterium]
MLTWFLLAVAAIQVPQQPGLYYLTKSGVERIEGRAVTLESGGGERKLSVKAPLASAGVRAEILGEHAPVTLNSSPVFYFRPQKNTDVVVGDLALVRLKVRRQHREFEVSTKGEWNSASGISLKDQVLFYLKQDEPGVYKITPADDLDPGEYGFYEFRGNGRPGLLYGFSVK